ncbi:MAG: undecaprenyl/decaprenyl-phosphate alpha-N-acetylglucosaminyl 1-phosphate transferase [Gemmatimonadetes bacterium]|nr:undecaprenyl/decaprenyl-phosphate alpha-N-acetylglucosaminyl 1-phosphate transferase [Gemmatimonadota bacterium]
MGSYLVVFFLAAAAVVLALPPLMRIAHRVGALDNTRQPPMPRIGGWGLAFGVTAALLLVGVVFEPAGLTLAGEKHSFVAVAGGAIAILLLGTVDDIRPLAAAPKFLLQILIAAGVYALGVRVQAVSFPFGSLHLIGVVSLAVTILWLVGLSNAFNLLDGADGVAAGSAFFSATAVFIMSVALGHPAIGLVAAALAGALLGFLPFNFPPARAFLGDAGSLLTGFLLAALGVQGSTKGPTLVAIAVPLLAFAVPVFDTTTSFLRRIVRGESPFAGDHDHLHHRLIRAGLSPRQVLAVVYGTSAVFALVSMLFINPGVRSYAVVLVVVGTAVWLVVRFLRLHELNELARVAKHGLLKPRSIAVNVQLRRAAETLEGAHTLEELRNALATLLSRSEFDEVLLRVAPASDRRGTTSTWRLSDGGFVAETIRRRIDEWEVICPFQGNGWNGELRLRRRFGRPSLLLDLNLLLEVVQPALAHAAGQIDSVATSSN